jgi:hypothetical protein
MSACCNAYVTFFDSTLVCKKCYQEQDMETLNVG